MSYFRIAELMELLALPRSTVRWRATDQSWPYEDRPGNGGKLRYFGPLDKLPSDVQNAIYDARPELAPAVENPELDWAKIQVRHARLTPAQRAVGEQRAQGLRAIAEAVKGGETVLRALVRLQPQTGISKGDYYRYMKRIDGVFWHNWPALLTNQYSDQPRRVEADMSAAAWEWIKTDWLRGEKPHMSECYDRLLVQAAAQKWAVPSYRTVCRRLNAIPPTIRVLAREGQDALNRMYPAQIRDKGHMQAMEAVCADGHKFDVFVRTPVGKVVRPILLAFQDIYSGLILGWRLGETESQDLVRLAWHDTVKRYDIAGAVYLDNGRGFAGKCISGGAPTRFRFKVLKEDPMGAITLLVGRDNIHWCKPYSGQSKPIERAWRDLAGRISKHPNNAGAYTGNNPTNKPHTYGQKVVAWADFEALVAAEITAHNSRTGRRSDVANGRSLQATFDDSYATVIPRKASVDQLRFCCLASELVTVDHEEAAVWLHKNKYWMPELAGMHGKKVMLRVDPANLQHGAFIYSVQGCYIGTAECVERTGFDNTIAASAHARARRNWLKAAKLQLDAERTMSLSQIQRQPEPETVPLPDTTHNVISAAFGVPKRAETAALPSETPNTEIQAKLAAFHLREQARFEAKQAERRKMQGVL